MVKDNETVMNEFNELVNMTPQELKKWLDEQQSQESGWSKDDGSETVGHDSGTRIVGILEKYKKSNDLSKYGEDDLAHMRKVVSYNKRHLAQEAKAKQDTDSKSYKSLKNWGHDPLKT